jgi:hypothetical protein
MAYCISEVLITLGVFSDLALWFRQIRGQSVGFFTKVINTIAAANPKKPKRIIRPSRSSARQIPRSLLRLTGV